MDSIGATNRSPRTLHRNGKRRAGSPRTFHSKRKETCGVAPFLSEQLTLRDADNS